MSHPESRWTIPAPLRMPRTDAGRTTTALVCWALHAMRLEHSPECTVIRESVLAIESQAEQAPQSLRECERTASGMGCRTHQYTWSPETIACNGWIKQARVALADRMSTSEILSISEKALADAGAQHIYDIDHMSEEDD